LLDEQPKDRQSMLVSKRAQSCDGFGGFHGSVRYYDNCRNVNAGQSGEGASTADRFQVVLHADASAVRGGGVRGRVP
jgi:hypothetical protein